MLISKSLIISGRVMIKILKSFFIWIFRPETLSNALFAVNIAQEVFSNKNAGNPEKNRAVLRKIAIAQEAIDTVQKFINNDETEKWAIGINKSKDKKTFRDFNATIVKDKHGAGKNGIDLGYKTKIKGMPFRVKYNPIDGSASGQIGPFGFNL